MNSKGSAEERAQRPRLALAAADPGDVESMVAGERSEREDQVPRWLIPRLLDRLTGQERFSDGTCTVLDFWQWAFSDLRSNVVRGVLAEYLVAQALGDTSPIRDFWGNWDVTSSTGVRVEVKASGYLQSWNQRSLSSIQFGRLTGRAWPRETNEFASDRSLHADVYVFAIHTCRDPDRYDPLSVEDWEFRVLSAAALSRHDHRTITLALVKQDAPTVYHLDELRDAVEHAHQCGDEPCASQEQEGQG